MNENYRADVVNRIDHGVSGYINQHFSLSVSGNIRTLLLTIFIPSFKKKSLLTSYKYPSMKLIIHNTVSSLRLIDIGKRDFCQGVGPPREDMLCFVNRCL